MGRRERADRGRSGVPLALRSTRQDRRARPGPGPERIGIAGFYELGSVAGDGVSLFSSRVQHSYGFGLRATLERIAPFRLDFGFSKDGMNVTARFGLSF